jgi:hypothetical protein
LHAIIIKEIMGSMKGRDWRTPEVVVAQWREGAALAGMILLVVALLWHVVAAFAGAEAVSRSYLPLVSSAGCAPIPDETYSAVALGGSHLSLPAELHPDLNLAVRGLAVTTAELQLVDYGGARDPDAPQLAGLLSSPPLSFGAAYQVFDWDWDEMRRGPKIADPPVTALRFDVRRGEALHVPISGYTIGDGWEVLVLYASSERITLKYTREDNVVYGYTLHVEDVCVEPRLLSLYETCEAGGRGFLPALREGQAFGRASGSGVAVAIRDHGRFLDPRSRKDWWQGY